MLWREFQSAAGAGQLLLANGFIVPQRTG